MHLKTLVAAFLVAGAIASPTKPVNKREPNPDVASLGFYIPPQPVCERNGCGSPPSKKRAEEVEKRDTETEPMPPTKADVVEAEEAVERRNSENEPLPPVCDGHPCPPTKATAVEAVVKRQTGVWPPPPICTPNPCNLTDGSDTEDVEKRDSETEPQPQPPTKVTAVATVAKRQEGSGSYTPPPVCSPHPCSETDGLEVEDVEKRDSETEPQPQPQPPTKVEAVEAEEAVAKRTDSGMPPACSPLQCVPTKRETEDAETENDIEKRDGETEALARASRVKVEAEEDVEKRDSGATETLPPFCSRHYCPPNVTGAAVARAVETGKA